MAERVQERYVQVNEEVEEYDENADEDFNPEKAAGEEDASSDEEEDDSAAKAVVKQARKRKAEDAAQLDSGDEATIHEQRRKRKKKVVETEHDGAESGGEGGFVRTRAQRVAEKAERKERKRATDGDVTIDVSAIWEELNSIPVGRPSPAPPKVVEVDGEQDKENAGPDSDDLITIRRRIEYAGEVTEIEETVPRSSKEAQHYLRSHPEADPNYKPPIDQTSTLRRPLKRPSIFEPNPTATIKGVASERLRLRAPSRTDVLIAERRTEEEQRKRAEKMTTVQKSALDWKGFVDQEEGLGQELEEYGKSKRGFLAREDFLGRADFVREEAARAARLKG